MGSCDRRSRAATGPRGYAADIEPVRGQSSVRPVGCPRQGPVPERTGPVLAVVL